jgi:hypothetical protein
MNVFSIRPLALLLGIAHALQMRMLVPTSVGDDAMYKPEVFLEDAFKTVM